MAKRSLNSSPYASRMVVSSSTKPQKVKKWASPGSGRLSSLRWPKTSTSSARSLVQAPWNRSGAGVPAPIRRMSCSTRRPARAMARKVMTAPMASFKMLPPDGDDARRRAILLPGNLERHPQPPNLWTTRTPCGPAGDRLAKWRVRLVPVRRRGDGSLGVGRSRWRRSAWWPRSPAPRSFLGPARLGPPRGMWSPAPSRVSLEVAADEAARERGLSNRGELPSGTGMAFLFPGDTTVAFWMKDTLVPLQIAFVGGDGRVVGLFEMSPCRAGPCPTYAPARPYRYAVELPSGAFTAAGIREGDRVVPRDPDALPAPS